MPYQYAWQKAMWVEKDKSANPEKYRVWYERGKAKAKAKREAERALNPRPPKAVMTDEQRKAQQRAAYLRRRETPEYKAKERERNRLRYNRDRKDYMKAYAQKDRATNPLRKTKETMARRFKDISKGRASPERVYEHLGCTWPEFLAHIEAQFKPGMTWQNQGYEWDYDHILPVTWFQHIWRDSERAVATAWHYTNLQPLWKRDNQRKGNRIVLSHLTPELAVLMHKAIEIAGPRAHQWRIIPDLKDAA